MRLDLLVRFTKWGLTGLAIGLTLWAMYLGAAEYRQKALDSYTQRSRRMAEKHCKAVQSLKDDYYSDSERVLFSCDDGFMLQ